MGDVAVQFHTRLFDHMVLVFCKFIYIHTFVHSLYTWLQLCNFGILVFLVCTSKYEWSWTLNEACWYTLKDDGLQIQRSISECTVWKCFQSWIIFSICLLSSLSFLFQLHSSSLVIRVGSRLHVFSSFTKSDKTLFPPLLIMSNVPTFVSCVYHHYVVSMFYYQVFFL